MTTRQTHGNAGTTLRHSMPVSHPETLSGQKVNINRSALCVTIMIMLASMSCVSSISSKCTQVKDTPIGANTRRDTDLRGITFYVYGSFSDDLDGRHITDGSIWWLESLIKSYNGTITDDPSDPDLDVAIIGSVQSSMPRGFSLRRLDLERINEERNAIIEILQRNKVEIITGELFIARLGSRP